MIPSAQCQLAQVKWRKEALSCSLRILSSDSGLRARRGGSPTLIFVAFSTLTGDQHPIHYDPAYAKNTRFGRPITHGLHLMALTALGATSLSEQLEESMVALLEQGCRFLRPVFAVSVLRSG